MGNGVKARKTAKKPKPERAQEILCSPFGTKVSCRVDGCRQLLDISTLPLFEESKLHFRRHYDPRAAVHRTQLTGFKLSKYMPGFVGLTKDHIVDSPSDDGAKGDSDFTGDVSLVYAHAQKARESDRMYPVVCLSCRRCGTSRGWTGPQATFNVRSC